MHANWSYPTQIRFGAGRISEIADACKSVGIKKPLLVTDPGLMKVGLAKRVIDICQENSVKLDVFADIRSNPTIENLETNIALIKEKGYDGVIAMGGGSAMDVGKLAAFMQAQDQPVWQFEDIGDNWKTANSAGILPIIAIPTSAGTGSEVGRAAVVSGTVSWRGHEQKTKKIIFHPQMMPQLVIADCELTVPLPAKLTAATGIDALSHCIEAYCARAFHPMADGIALMGIDLIKKNLLQAYQDGTNLEARGGMLAAAILGSSAFQKGLGAVHSLSHPLGAIYDTHHGLTNAVLLPYVLRYNKEAIKERIERAAQFLDFPQAQPAFETFLAWIIELRETLAIPNTLPEIGIQLDNNEEKQMIAEMALADPSTSGNPQPLTVDDFLKILTLAHG